MKLFHIDTSSRKNNFDFIRFVAASFVIFSHSYGLSIGNNNHEPLWLLSRGQLLIGTLSVIVFFVISGFLITQSFVNKPDPKSYFRSRVLRIYPALIVIVLLTVFLIGPIFTTITLKNYFLNLHTYLYLLNMLIPLSMNQILPGVFSNNAWAPDLNGSLWTIFFEFLCYIMIGLLGAIKQLNRRNLIILLCIDFLLSQLPFGIFHGYFIGRTITYSRYFLVGTLIYMYKDKFILNNYLAIVSVIALCLSLYAGFFNDAFIVFGSYLVIYLAFIPNKSIVNFAKYGDFSYGLYIIAYPVQQSIIFLFGGKMNHWTNFIIAYPIILFLSVASWHLIEKQCLKFKSQSPIRTIQNLGLFQ